MEGGCCRWDVGQVLVQVWMEDGENSLSVRCFWLVPNDLSIFYFFFRFPFVVFIELLQWIFLEFSWFVFHRCLLFHRVVWFVSGVVGASRVWLLPCSLCISQLHTPALEWTDMWIWRTLVGLEMTPPLVSKYFWGHTRTWSTWRKLTQGWECPKEEARVLDVTV